MKRYACPSCKLPTFSYWQKHFLGPARTIRCSGCGASVSVPWLRFLLFAVLATFAPLCGGFIALMAVEPPDSAATLLVFLSVVVLVSLPLLWLYDKSVPLVCR